MFVTCIMPLQHWLQQTSLDESESMWKPIWCILY
uniref:Uncharacterized protein n=1 Tax=Manihot esculenta TaxID=3983 RepID=A0A2C9WIW3_MANES